MIKDLTAFSTKLNLTLFNDALQFILGTANPREGLLNLETSTANLQLEYNVIYLGELLELRQDIRDVRALALALSYARNALREDMFTGTQRQDFLNKIESMSFADTYLLGALHILAPTEATLRGLVQHVYRHTEELVFVLSLFEDFSEGYGLFEEQLTKLFSTHRTISPIGNIGLFTWLISQLKPLLHGSKKKETLFLRTLLTLTDARLKEGSPRYKTLLAGGYKDLEILYMNYMLTTSNRTSPTKVRLAVDLCHAFINSPDAHAPATYDLLAQVLETYRVFPIRVDNTGNILDALRGRIRITNPQTFLWLYGLNGMKDLVYINLLEDRWRFLAETLGTAKYFDLIVAHIVQSSYTSDELHAILQHFEALTGVAYTACLFETYNAKRFDVFAKLVDCGVLSLQAMYNHANENAARYIAQYIGPVKTRHAFEFLSALFEQDPVPELCASFTETVFRELTGYYNNKQLNLHRDFLSTEEHRQLVAMLDKGIFLYRPTVYRQFVFTLLQDSFSLTLYSRAELRPVFDALFEDADSKNTSEYRNLRKYFLAEGELLELQQAEIQEAAKQQRDEVLITFNQQFDGSVQSLDRFAKHYQYYRDLRVPALEVVSEHLKDVRVRPEDFSDVLYLYAKMVSAAVKTRDEILTLITNMKEVPHVHDTGDA